MKNKEHKKNVITKIDSLFPNFTYEYAYQRLDRSFFTRKEIREINNRKQLIELMALIYFSGTLKVIRYRGVQMTRIRLLRSPIFSYVDYKAPINHFAKYTCDAYLTDKGRALIEYAELEVIRCRVIEMAQTEIPLTSLSF